MTEILTESFCERCGTRYTFESTAPRKSRLSRVRTLSKGVRNFVMSDDASFSEAMAEARSDEELAATAHQLDAFHRTFNFCLTCRQYTCAECWNSAEGRCLTCAPMPGQEQQASLLDLAPLAIAGLDTPTNGNGAGHEEPDVEAWPEMDLPADRLARVLDFPAAELEPATAEPEPVAEPGSAAWDAELLAWPGVPAADEPLVEATAEPFVEATAAEAPATGPFPEAQPVDEGPAPAVAQPGSPVRGMAPGQSLDDAIAAYEAMLEQAAGPAAEPAAAAAGVPEPVAEAAPEPAAEAALEPIPQAEAAAEAGPALEGEPAAEPPVPVVPEAPVAATRAAEPPAPSPASVDRVEQPAWPVSPTPTVPVAPSPPPAAPAPAQTPWLTVAPEDSPPPQWPAVPQWPSASARLPAPTSLAGRPFVPQGDSSALWAASAQEVLGAAPAPLATTAPATAQPCVSCGLSLSANARFCRRCGSRQG